MLSEELNRINNSVIRIRNKMKVNTAPIEEVAQAVENFVGSVNTYKVKSIEERDLLDAKEEDVCVVHNEYLEGVTANKEFQKVYIPESVTLDAAVTSSSTIRDERMYTMITLSPTTFRVRNMSSGTYITMTSTDGITYTKSSTSDSIELRYPMSIGDDVYRQELNKLILVEAIEFPGIFIYKKGVWSNLNIGVDIIPRDVLINKKAYSNTGMINGERDMSKYRNFNFYIQNTEPTNKKGLWCTYDSNYTNPLEYWTDYEDTNSSNNITFEETFKDLSNIVKANHHMESSLTLSSSSTTSTGWSKCNDITHIERLIMTIDGVEYKDTEGLIIGDLLYLISHSSDGTTQSSKMVVLNLTDYTYTVKTVPSITTAHNLQTIASDGTYIYMAIQDTSSSSSYVNYMYVYTIATESWSSRVSLLSTSDYELSMCVGILPYNGVAAVCLSTRTNIPSAARIIRYTVSSGSKSTVSITATTDFSVSEVGYAIDMFEDQNCTITDAGLYSVPGFSINLASMTATTLKNAVLANNKTSGPYGILHGTDDYYRMYRTESCAIYKQSTGETVYPQIALPASVNVILFIYFRDNIMYLYGDDNNVYTLDVSNLISFTSRVLFQIGESGTPCELFRYLKLPIINVSARVNSFVRVNVINKVYVGDGTSWTLIKDNTM